MRLKLASVSLGLLLLVPVQAQERADISKEYREACEMLVCRCSCNEQLTVCAMQNCSSATPMRAEVRETLQKGEAVSQIVDGFVARLGKQVLSAPTMKGFDITAWIMPFAILGLGLVLVSWIAYRMARPAAATEEAPPVAFDPRVDKELKEFEEES